MKIAMSSGHGKYIRGASGSPVPPEHDEVNQARKIVDRTAEMLNAAGVTCVTYHDDTSDDQSENLNRIVNWHNSQTRDLDISVHLNAYDGNAHGTEMLYVTQQTLASVMSAAVAEAGGFTNRGPKYNGGLAFLNGTDEPAVLCEMHFCDNTSDCQKHDANFEAICEALAESMSGVSIDETPPEPEEPAPEPPDEGNRVDIVGKTQGDVAVYINGSLIVGNKRCANVVRMRISLTGEVTLSINGQEFHNNLTPEEPPLLQVSGPCSWFGGPEDMGVSSSEGLAFIYEYSDAEHLFLDQQPPGTTGLARRLNTEEVYYVACRWDYSVTPKTMLSDKSRKALVRANGKEFEAWPADWGPHEDTGRVADISHCLMEALGVTTDDPVEVIYPA